MWINWVFENCICVFVYLYTCSPWKCSLGPFATALAFVCTTTALLPFCWHHPERKTSSSFSQKLLIFYRFSFFFLLQDLQAPLQGVVQNVQLLGREQIDWLEYDQFQTNYNKSMFWCTFNLSIVNFKQKDYKKLISS